MTNPDTCHDLPPADLKSTDIRQDVTAQSGAWLPARAATAFLDIALRTLYRRVDRGEIQRRNLDGGRVEFWIPGASLDLAMDSDTDPETSQLVALDRSDALLALLERQAELTQQQMTPLVETIRELERENGRLQAELTTAQEALAKVTHASNRQPWWRRWLGA
jgi:hypothetical protein